MSDWSKWVIVAVVLVFIVPFGAMFVRRLVRGEPFNSDGGPLPPPSGPGVNL